ncbi:putative phloem protein [Helianthus anomalus]
MPFYGSYEKMFFSESRFVRFGEAIHLGDDSYIYVKNEVQSQLVSSETTYACYLVYKLPEDQSGFEAPVKLEDKRCDSVDKICYIYLTSP